MLLLMIGGLTSHQHAGVSHGRNCLNNCMCCYSEIEVADQACHIIQTLYTYTGPTTPRADPDRVSTRVPFSSSAFDVMVALTRSCPL